MGYLDPLGFWWSQDQHTSYFPCSELPQQLKPEDQKLDSTELISDLTAGPLITDCTLHRSSEPFRSSGFLQIPSDMSSIEPCSQMHMLFAAKPRRLLAYSSCDVGNCLRYIEHTKQSKHCTISKNLILTKCQKAEHDPSPRSFGSTGRCEARATPDPPRTNSIKTGPGKMCDVIAL